MRSFARNSPGKMTALFAESALAAIEFPAALDQVSQYAVTPQGAARVRGLRPLQDLFAVTSELDRVAAMAARLAAGDDVEPVAFPDVEGPLGRLRLDGAVLDGEELVAVGRVIAAAKIVGGKLRRAGRVSPNLANLAAEPLPDDLGAALDKALDEEGRVKDHASKDLARLRRELVEVRAQIVGILERLLGGMDARHRAGDAPTMRNGRYVVPLRRDSRAKVGGIVHDESATQSTLFVEPPETIEMGNRLRSVEAEEAREVQRILRELSAELRPHADGLDASYEMLVVVDCLYARGRSAQAQNAVPPRIVAAGAEPLKLAGAAHPLLFGRGVDIVRFDLVLEDGERTVLISGPNTGGKTVLIKAVGLAVVLGQSGVMPSVGEGSVLPIFDTLIADIGDQQSISESLSTFSAHVATLRQVLKIAGPASLVLLDELGTGTDPAEGAALAAAVLRALTRRRVTTVATTHLGALKELAGTTPGIVNASLAFDAATLAPTYRFTKGVPGRSYGLAIARRLGVDADVLADAEATIPEDVRRLDATLAAAEARGQSLDAQESSLREQATDLDMLKARLEAAERKLSEQADDLARREKELAAAIRTAKRETLLQARAEVETALSLAREGKEKEARRALEQRITELKREEGEGREEGEERSEEREEGENAVLKPGVKVRIRSLNLEGAIDSVQGNDVYVTVRGRRVRVRASDLASTSTSPHSPHFPHSPHSPHSPR